MPVYVYRCQRCGIEFKKTQVFSDKPLTHCPECRTSHVWRVPQRAAIVFKGSGWYSTDQRPASGQHGTPDPKAGHVEGSTGAESER